VAVGIHEYLVLLLEYQLAASVDCRKHALLEYEFVFFAEAKVIAAPEVFFCRLIVFFAGQMNQAVSCCFPVKASIFSAKSWKSVLFFHRRDGKHSLGAVIADREPWPPAPERLLFPLLLRIPRQAQLLSCAG
jgi:hypothetical protein